MSLSFSSSVFGIQAAFHIMSVSAHNTANINTDGYKKQRVSLSEGNHGGVMVNIRESSEPGPGYQHANGNISEASNVEISEEIPIQIGAKHLLSANVAVLKTSEEMQKSLLDIIA
jgi:flagellar basal-body rod protein FlgC